MFRLCFLCLSHLKLIELISATDADDPVDGHHFYFSMIPDKHINPNFTIRDNQGMSQHELSKFRMAGLTHLTLMQKQ